MFRNVLELLGPKGAIYCGDSLIAAERTSRRCRAMEISPPFVDVAIRLWEKATGQLAVLDGDVVHARRGREATLRVWALLGNCLGLPWRLQPARYSPFRTVRSWVVDATRSPCFPA